MNINKGQLANDVFSTEAEARVRSMDLGMNGSTHAHPDAQGQAHYMPGESHEAYMAYYDKETEEAPYRS